EAEGDVVWVNISNLRKKLKNLDSSAKIRSSRGVGYSIFVNS
ncbi:MAG: helix-turn-helix domain-containing protein, partial [Lachnospiraceae bacterium]|nr:helix-turn-helix domain-containing protein [Lachnospiraceae bacterium]